MHKRITFRGVEHSAFIENHANKQLEKIEEFLLKEARTPISIDLVIQPGKLHAHHLVELRIKTPEYNRVSHYEGDNFNDVLDRVIDVMYLELREDKDKRDDKKKSVGRHDEFKK